MKLILWNLNVHLVFFNQIPSIKSKQGRLVYFHLFQEICVYPALDHPIIIKGNIKLKLATEPEIQRAESKYEMLLLFRLPFIIKTDAM